MARTEELLDIEYTAKVIYGVLFGATIVLMNAINIHVFPVVFWPFKIFFGLMEKILGIFLGDVDWSIYFIVSYVVFTPLACYFIGASGPGLLRRLLYRIMVQPKLDRSYRENHEEMQAQNQSQGPRRSLWTRLRERYSLRLPGLQDLLSLTTTERGYIVLPSDNDEASDALSLYDIPSNEEEPGDTARHYSDESTAEEHPRTREQIDERQQQLERARLNGTKLGTWIGSKIGAAFTFPLNAAVRVGELSSELGNRTWAMRLSRIQREERQDLPGDIYLP